MVFSQIFCNVLSICLVFVCIFIYDYSLLVSVHLCILSMFLHSCFPRHIFVLMLDLSPHPESACALFGYFRVSGIFIKLHLILVFWKFALLP